MRFVVGLLALAGAVNLALAEDPPAAPATAPAAPAASAPSAAAAPAAAAAATTPASAAQSATASAAAAKPAVDKDIQHFTQEGFKPEMRGGQEIYCRKELAIGSRLAPQKTCGTIEELKVMERQTRSDMEQAQQRQSSGPSSR
jgi:hypothetical protein